MVATQRYPVPKYFKMVEHFAGDSTINSVSVGTFTNDDDDNDDDDDLIIFLDNGIISIIY
jgi:hypothetical protein